MLLHEWYFGLLRALSSFAHIRHEVSRVQQEVLDAGAVMDMDTLTNILRRLDVIHVIKTVRQILVRSLLFEYHHVL